MTRITYPQGLLLFTACWLAVRVFVWIKRRRVDIKREALLLIMYVNLAVILRFTFYPFGLPGEKIQPLLFSRDMLLPLRVNAVPFTNIFVFESKRDTLINVIGNAAMFIPTGIVLPSLYKNLRGFFKTVGVGALISLIIELLQLPFFERVSDVNDLILNTLGCAAGYGVYAAVRAVLAGKSKAQ